LHYMGTNGESAVPFLLTYLERRDLKNLGPVNPAETLASVGRNQPNIVIPALIKALAVSTGYARAEVAQALGTFGTDAKQAVAPLVAVCDDPDALVRTRAATALKRIAPDKSGTLTPLIQNLTNKTTLVRQQAIWALDSLGTNALEALPALISTCLRDPVDEVRSEVMQCFYSIGKCTDEVVTALVANLSHTNYFVHGHAVNILAGFARDSKPVFIELLKARGSPYKEVREQARNNVTSIVYYHQTFLVECFEHPDAEVRFRAFQTFAFDGGVDIPVARKAMTKALKDEDSRVRDVAKDTLGRWDRSGVQ
jgi:HEAT repeat protein